MKWQIVLSAKSFVMRKWTINRKYLVTLMLIMDLFLLIYLHQCSQPHRDQVYISQGRKEKINCRPLYICSNQTRSRFRPRLYSDYLLPLVQNIQTYSSRSSIIYRTSQVLDSTPRLSSRIDGISPVRRIVWCVYFYNLQMQTSLMTKNGINQLYLHTKWLRIRASEPCTSALQVRALNAQVPIIPRLLLLPLKYGGRAYVVVIFGLKVEDAFDSFEEVQTKIKEIDDRQNSRAALQIIGVPRCPRNPGI